MNLMLNGMDAMVVSVSDTGGGIAADELKEIFNTFVTTKAEDTGMRPVALRSEAFATPQEFLNSKPPTLPGCPVLDVRLQGSRLDCQPRLAKAEVTIPIISSPDTVMSQ